MTKINAVQEAKGEATQPRPTDAAGRELDGFGLPVNGPARVRALAGRPDPNVDPAAWDALGAAAVKPAAVTSAASVESKNG
jgi:hypothetical protein